jgi:hypothetical protein
MHEEGPASDATFVALSSSLWLTFLFAAAVIGGGVAAIGSFE